jgi:anti-anti-sigma regulatory factor
MPVHISYIEEENRLDLSFEGNLDVSVSRDISGICRRVSSSLMTCIIDLSGVERLFDSGVGLLQMLHRRLSELGVTIVILSDQPEIRERIPSIAWTSLHAMPRARLGRFA